MVNKMVNLTQAINMYLVSFLLLGSLKGNYMKPIIIAMYYWFCNIGDSVYNNNSINRGKENKVVEEKHFYIGILQRHCVFSFRSLC